VYANELATRFQAGFEKQGGTVSSILRYPDIRNVQTIDFKSIIDNICANKPDVIYIGSYADDGAAITKALKPRINAGYKPLLLGCDANYNQDFILAAEPDVDEGISLYSSSKIQKL
jgi:ABC-type branched-subunit amino acid transport system substrate-binding protein